MNRNGHRRILVTGASGFIGGTLTRHLVGGGAHVRAVVRGTSSTAGLAMPGVEIVVAEVSIAESIRGVVEDCDLVINAAGTVSGSAEMQRSVNVDGARNVTEAAIAAGVSRLVHVSSAGIYGFRTPGDVDESTPVDPGPLPYGATKAEGEAVVRELAAAGAWPCRSSVPHWSTVRAARCGRPGCSSGQSVGRRSSSGTAADSHRWSTWTMSSI